MQPNHYSADRDIRQRDLVPPAKLKDCVISVIGVGAIGRQVALQLAAMGAPILQLIDPDIVEPVNLACQGYWESDLGLHKVVATSEQCRQLNPTIQILGEAKRFQRSMHPGNVVFCCVDAIETRGHIWEHVKDKAEFFADGRMSAEVLRVLVATDFVSRKHYPTTLFQATEAYQGACTAKSTIFCANIAAGWMLAQFSRWLRGLPTDPDVTLNLLASELTVSTTPK